MFFFGRGCVLPQEPTVRAGVPCDVQDLDRDGQCDRRLCGDTTGSGNTDVPCSCGDFVATSTVLAGDPVASTTCTSDGLKVGGGVTLDLAGGTITGNGEGVGMTLRSGATVHGGTVREFHTGMVVIPEGLHMPTFVHSMTMEWNQDRGLMVGLTDARDRVRVAGIAVRDNGGDGIAVESAPGFGRG